jgi:hypothetical protein
MYTLIITTDFISGANNLGDTWNYPEMSEAKVRLELNNIKEQYGKPSFVNGMMIFKAKRIVGTKFDVLYDDDPWYTSDGINDGVFRIWVPIWD